MKNFLSSKLTNLLPLLLLFGIITVSAQDASNKKNSVYASIGSVVFINQVSISYDRTVYEYQKIKVKAKANYGHVLSNHYDFEENTDVTWNYWTLAGVFQFSVLEVNTGVSLTQNNRTTGIVVNNDLSESFLAANFYGSVGVRLEKDWFHFRAGVGNMELLYAGVGVNF